jgi:hypothetical protein
VTVITDNVGQIRGESLSWTSSGAKGRPVPLHRQFLGGRSGKRRNAMRTAGEIAMAVPAWTPTDPVEKMPNFQPPINWCPAPPKIVSTDVFPYQANEVAISHTEAGHLTADVVLTGAAASNSLCQFLLIRDFGVNWRHIKALTLHDALLRAQLNRFETDNTLQFMILGYSDSAGPERNNVFLRTGRARNVFHLLGPSARSRTAVVKPATPNEYFTVNSTVASRAQNRSVVIHILANGSGTI